MTGVYVMIALIRFPYLDYSINKDDKSKDLYSNLFIFEINS
jgi:hypothetical protein